MSRFVLFALAAGLTFGESLETILAHMDAAAKTSNSFSADLVWRKYTKAIDDTDEQSGYLKLKRVNNRVVGRLDIEKPNVFIWRFTPSTWEKYLPKAREIQVWKPEKVSKSSDQMFLSIFGNTSANVRKVYNATAIGEETINGIKTTKLELVPKDKKAQNYVSKIELWIPIGESYTVQQRITQPNGDFDLHIYYNAQLNPGLPASAFDFVAPPGTKQNVMN